VYWGGQRIGAAIPQHIGRHAHPKAPADEQPEPVTATGIDFIQLLAEADRAETGQRLNLAHLADEPAEASDTSSIADDRAGADEQADQ
jgi:hypothetical protein